MIKLGQGILRTAQGLAKTMPQYNFGMKTTATTIIRGSQPATITYDRDYFELRSVNPDFEKKQLLQQQEIKKQEIAELVFNKVENDNNPQNLIPVTVNSNFINKTAKVRKTRAFALQDVKTEDGTEPQPFIQIIKPKEPLITVTGKRKNLRSTIKKMKIPLKSVKKLQVFDALSVLDANHTKAARYIAQVVRQVVRHGTDKDMDPARMYIHGIIVGKQRRFKLLYYKAKSQFGRMNKDIVQLKITLQEKPIKEMYKQVIQGKTTPALAYMLRQQLKEKKADLATIQKYQHILTAKGRQQKRLMFKRQVIAEYQQYRRYGVDVNKKAIAERLLEVQGSQWTEAYERQTLEFDQQSINKRTAIYKQNEKMSGF